MSYVITLASLLCIVCLSSWVAVPEHNPVLNLLANICYTKTDVPVKEIDYWIEGSWIGIGYRQELLNVNNFQFYLYILQLASVLLGALTIFASLSGILKTALSYWRIKSSIKASTKLSIPLDSDGTKEATIYSSNQIISPFVFGLIKAKVIFPEHFLKNEVFQSHDFYAILHHELAHVERRDYLVNSIQIIFDAFFFQNPAIKWISNLIRNLREYCCDQIAAYKIGNRFSYARSLINYQERVFDKNDATLKIGVFDNSIIHRVESLCEATPPRIQSLPLKHWIIPVVCIALVVTGSYTPPLQKLGLLLQNSKPLNNQLVSSYDLNWNKAHLQKDFDGTINGCKPMVDRFGNAQGATRFNGSSDFISINEGNSLQIEDELTVSSWIYVNEHSRFMSWLSKSIKENNYSQWRIGYGFKPTQWGFTQYTKSGRKERANAWYDLWVQNCDIPLKRWVHTVSVVNVNGGWNKLYVNGKLVAQIDKVKPFIIDDSPLIIGYQHDDDVYFNGGIDDIRIYDQSFTEKEVFNLYLKEKL